MRQERDREPKVQSITSAPEPRSAGMARRQKVYSIQMATRLVLFLVTVFTWDHVPLWASVVMATGAVVLPYTAVLLANEPSTRRSTATEVPRLGIEGRSPHHLTGGSP